MGCSQSKVDPKSDQGRNNSEQSLKICAEVQYPLEASPLRSEIASLRLCKSNQEIEYSDLLQKMGSLRNQYQALQTELKSLSASPSQKDSLISDLTTRLQQAQEEIADLQKCKIHLSEYQLKLTGYETQIIDLTRTLEALHQTEQHQLRRKAEIQGKKEILGLLEEAEIAELMKIDANLTEKLVKRHLEALKFMEKAADLEMMVGILEKGRKDRVRKVSIKTICAVTKGLLHTVVGKWRQTTVFRRMKRVNLSTLAKRHSFHQISHLLQTALLKAFYTWKTRDCFQSFSPKSVKLTLHSASVPNLECGFSPREKEDLASDNPFNSIISTYGMKWGSAMPARTINGYIDTFLEKKAKMDATDLAEKRKPRTVSEFITEHFLREFGLTDLAVRKISQFVPGLNNLKQEENMMADFLCRCMKGFHSSPFPFEIATFLIKIRSDFLNLRASKRLVRHRASTAPSTPLKSSPKSVHKELHSSVLLIDLLPEVSLQFGNFPDVCETLVANLKSERATEEEFVSFLICYEITKQGLKAESAFTKLDSSYKGVLSPSELASGLKSSFKVCVRTPNLELTLSKYSSSRTGLTLKDFARCIRLSDFSQAKVTLTFSVTETEFLTAACKAYDEMVERDKRRMAGLFVNLCPNGKRMKLVKFIQAVEEIAPGTEREALEILFEDACSEAGTQNFTPDLFEKVMFAQGFGGIGKGPFSKRHSVIEGWDSASEARDRPRDDFCLQDPNELPSDLTQSFTSALQEDQSGLSP